MTVQRVSVGLFSAALMVCCSVVQAAILEQTPGTDYIVFEAEAYDSIEGDEFTGWLEVELDGDLESDFGTQILPADSNVSGTAMYDQVGDGNFTDLLNYRLQFAEPGVYAFYMRYSMIEDNTDTGYGNEDSFYMPLDLGELPEQDGWFSFPKQGHDDPYEDPPYWEGHFHWAGPFQYQDIPEQIEFDVRPADVGSVIDFTISTRESGGVLDAVVLSQSIDLLPEELDELLEDALGPGPDVTALEAGDADQDLDFDQLDLVRVQVAAKYLTGQPATWGEGDWDAAPGGSPGNPPAGNGMFDQLDIIAALANGLYLTGPYGAINPGGTPGDGQTSITYNPSTGEVGVDAPAGVDLTSINIDSAGGIFTGEAAQNLGGSFDNDADNNIFKATFGSSFGSLTFGNVATPGLSEDFVANDLTVVGSLAGGGDLGNVDLIYVPEPSTIALLALGLVVGLGVRRRRR